MDRMLTAKGGTLGSIDEESSLETESLEKSATSSSLEEQPGLVSVDRARSKSSRGARDGCSDQASRSNVGEWSA